MESESGDGATGNVQFVHPSAGAAPEAVPLATTDSFTLETLWTLYESGRSEGKVCLVAVVRTGDVSEPGRRYVDVYSAHAMNKVLFRRTPGSGRLVSRYDAERPLVAKNPMTNTTILGEVEYYALGFTAPEDVYAAAASASAWPQSPFGPDDDLPAVLVGSDYHFVHSPDLRALFVDAALEPADAEVLLDARGSAGAGGLMMADAELEAQFGEMIARLVRATEGAQGMRVIQVPYPRALLFGMLALAYILVVSLVVQHGMIVLISDPVTPPDLSWYWTILPFLAYFMDRYTVSLFNRYEHIAFVVAKLVGWTIFILLPVVTFSAAARKYAIMRGVLDIVFPVASVIYTFSTYVYLSSRITLA